MRLGYHIGVVLLPGAVRTADTLLRYNFLIQFEDYCNIYIIIIVKVHIWNRSSNKQKNIWKLSFNQQLVVTIFLWACAVCEFMMCAQLDRKEIGANRAMPPLATATMSQHGPNIDKYPIVANVWSLCAIGTHKLATLDILNHIQQLKQL